MEDNSVSKAIKKLPTLSGKRRVLVQQKGFVPMLDYTLSVDHSVKLLGIMNEGHSSATVTF
jgi:hypothetical protein